MPRTVAEWIGKTADSKVPKRVAERLWKACEGRCKCGRDLIDQKWEIDHIIALAIWLGDGHGNRECNLQILGTKCCHKSKTKLDMEIKHRASRKLRHAVGIKRTKHVMPGSKASNMKKCVDGRVIDRRTGKEWGR